MVAQQFDSFGEIFDDLSAFGFVFVSGREGYLEDVAHLAGCASRPGWQVRDPLVDPATWMSQGCLVGGLGVQVVGGPAVVDQGGVEVGVEQIGGLVEAAAVSGAVVGDPRGCGHPHPRGGPTDTPAGLVRHHDRRLVDSAADLGVEGYHGGRGGLGGLAESAGGLLGMSALHPVSATLTAANAHLEAGRRRRRQQRKVGLELLGVTFVFDLAATIRTPTRQRGIQRAVRVGRCQTMTVTAMSLARLAARPPRLVDWFVAATERSGLTLPRAASFVEQPLQLGDPPILLGQPLLQSGHHRLQTSYPRICFGFASRTRNRQPRSLGSSRPPHCPISSPQWWTRYPMTLRSVV